MKKYLAFTIIECTVALLCMACTMPLLFSLMQHVIHSQQNNKVALLAVNELLNYKSIMSNSVLRKNVLLRQWKIDLDDNPYLLLSKLNQHSACLVAKNDNQQQWCLNVVA